MDGSLTTNASRLFAFRCRHSTGIDCIRSSRSRRGSHRPVHAGRMAVSSPPFIRRRFPPLLESVLPVSASGSVPNGSSIAAAIVMGSMGSSGEARKDCIDADFSETRKNPDGSLIHRGFIELGMVPRRGLEPPRCYSLVPETSASTNSAIWAHLLQGTDLATRFEFQEREQSYQK